QGAGTVVLSGGMLNATFGMAIGQYGESTGTHAFGTFSQTGGCATIGRIEMGLQHQSGGTCILSGGSMTVSNNIIVGFDRFGTGTFVVANGGSLHLLGDLNVGYFGQGY